MENFYRLPANMPLEATLLEARGGFVLCSLSSSPAKFVSWRIAHNGQAISGCYTKDITSAVEIFNERINELSEA